MPSEFALGGRGKGVFLEGKGSEEGFFREGAEREF